MFRFLINKCFGVGKVFSKQKLVHEKHVLISG